MKSNYHTHSTWCDGAASPREMVEAAIAKGFDVLGFSSHAMLPGDMLPWPLTTEKLAPYAAEIRSLAAEYAGRIKIQLGVEADYLPGEAVPDRSVYASIAPDYIIGSIHFLRAPDGAVANVDKSPESFVEDVAAHFGGDCRAFASAYFAAERDMAATHDFDVVGHPDLIRKFNSRLRWLDESAPWYLAELEATADAIAASGKIVEVNTGGISRGWMDDAYPSPAFRAMLRERGVRFILSADAHGTTALDCAFERFAEAEDWIHLNT